MKPRGIWILVGIGAACAGLATLRVHPGFFDRFIGRRVASVARGSVPLSPRGMDFTLPKGDLSPSQIEAIFAGFAAQDVAKALAATDALDPISRQAALLGILPVLARESPELALEVADTYADSPANRYGLLKVAVNAWIAQGGTGPVQAYYAQQPNTGSLDGAYAALASSIAASNPGGAGPWLDRIGDAALREEATVAVIALIKDSNPDVASKLVGSMINSTPGGSNEAVTIARLEETVPAWVQKDPSAAFSFVYSLNAVSSPARRALLQRLGLITSQ
jgi:hypothetical protein